MTDKKLADKVVELGVVEIDVNGMYEFSHPDMDGRWQPFTAKVLGNSWAVAGALMEKCGSFTIDALDDEDVETMWAMTAWAKQRGAAHHESLPRAIIEACIEALGG